MTKRSKEAVLIFTRVPIAGETKTRLMPFLSGKECASLHEGFIEQIYKTCQTLQRDILVFYTPEDPKGILKRIFSPDQEMFVQEGQDLGEKMKQAFRQAFSMGYQSCILIGTDIPLITNRILEDAFESLKEHELVIHPTKDGGYYLIGMKKEHDTIWKIPHYGTNTVIEDTLNKIKEDGIDVYVGEKLQDVDTKEDLLEVVLSTEYIERYIKEKLHILEEKDIRLRILGQGEYNRNYSFVDPKNQKKMVLRINTGSQMHLEKQIEYEAHALKLLEPTMRTPKVYFVDGSKKYFPYGILIMEFLEGRPLDYRTDMMQAAKCLADIHSLPIKEDSILLTPEDPFQAMIEECREMADTYLFWDFGEDEVKMSIRRMLSFAENGILKTGITQRHLINTELNSGNFLIQGPGKENYLIDWEKPILGEVEQDLAHFLAPTTTFWKTDVILNRGEMEEFLAMYKEAVKGRFDVSGLKDRFPIYLMLTCLRGITWCSMAFVEYSTSDRVLRNDETFAKIKEYLQPGFLHKIEHEYFTTE